MHARTSSHTHTHTHTHSLSLSHIPQEAVQDRVDRGDVVYIHCWGGRGRSGTVGAALMWLHEQGAVAHEEILLRLQKVRARAHDNSLPHPPSIVRPRGHTHSLVPLI